MNPDLLLLIPAVPSAVATAAVGVSMRRGKEWSAAWRAAAYAEPGPPDGGLDPTAPTEIPAAATADTAPALATVIPFPARTASAPLRLVARDGQRTG